MLYTQRAFFQMKGAIKLNNQNEMFSEYEDVVTVDDVTKMLRISRVSVYKLLGSGRIFTLKCGKKYIIPKRSIIDFLAVSPKRGGQGG